MRIKPNPPEAKSRSKNLGMMIHRNRWTSLFLLIAVSLIACFSIVQRVKKEIPVDFTPQAIFMDGGHDLDRLREIEQHFIREDNDFIVLLNSSNVLSTPHLKSIESIHLALEKHPEVESVFSIYSAQTLHSTDGMLEILDVWDHPQIEDLLNNSAYKGFLLSEDKSTTLIRARIDAAHERSSDLAPIINDLIDIVDQQSVPDDLKIHKTGVPHIRVEVVDMMLNDNFVYAPILTVLFLVTISLLFGSVWLGLAPMGGVLVSVLWALGILMAMGIQFNVLSILVPLLTLIIGVADGIHVASRYREEIIRGQSQEEAMGITMQKMLSACFLTTFTTSVGFLSLIVAQTKVIRDFGLHASISVMVAFVAVLWVVPTWLSFVNVQSIKKHPSSTKRLYEKLDQWVFKKRTPILWMTLLLCSALVVFGQDIRPNSHLLEMYHKDHPTHEAIKLAEHKLSGIVPVFVHIEMKDGSILEPSILMKIKELDQFFSAQDPVLWSSSLSDQIQELHKHLSGENTIPEDISIIEQELYLLEMSNSDSLSHLMSSDQKRGRILALCADSGGQSYIEMRHSVQSHAEFLFQDLPVNIDVTGDGMMASIGIDQLIVDLLTSIGLVLIVIFFTLYLLLRNFKMALIASLPNIIPLLFTLAALKLIGADLQTSNVISFTVAVGLAVDDTIHFIVRYRQELQAGKSHRYAITQSFTGAGHAIVLTSILLLVGFGTL